MQAFLAKVVDIGNTRAADEDLVRSVLIPQLRSIAFPRFKFDGYLLVVEKVCTLENDTKRALSDLLPHSIVYTDDVGG